MRRFSQNAGAMRAARESEYLLIDGNGLLCTNADQNGSESKHPERTKNRLTPTSPRMPKKCSAPTIGETFSGFNFCAV